MTTEDWNSARLIKHLRLEPHPEGGWYRQTFSDQGEPGQRAFSTAIYYLLEKGQISRWHKVDAAEIWHFYAGSPLELMVSADGKSSTTHVLGVDFGAAQLPQAAVPAGHWQSAKSLGEWTLVGCTVAPGFEFRGFEMAQDGWAPG